MVRMVDGLGRVDLGNAGVAIHSGLTEDNAEINLFGVALDCCRRLRGLVLGVDSGGRAIQDAQIR